MTSHEAKMPEMPPAAYVGVQRGEYVALYSADQMRAMYLAGLEAARQAVPERKEADWNDEITHRRHEGHNACRAATLSNLTALVKEAQK